MNALGGMSLKFKPKIELLLGVAHPVKNNIAISVIIFLIFPPVIKKGEASETPPFSLIVQNVTYIRVLF